jgi:uncharacterized phiE125 gp8 family phage protein
MLVKVVTAPAFEPITLAQAKLHLREDGTEQDVFIAALIATAREVAEHETGRALATQTRERILDAFPAGEIKLIGAPVASVVSVRYLDVGGVDTTLAAERYSLDGDSEPAWLLPAYDTDWPDSLDAANSVRVRYVCGYAEGACPAAIRQWMLLQIGHWFASREAASDKPKTATPFLAGLLDAWRIY